MTYPPHQPTDSPDRSGARPSAPPYGTDPTTATRHLCAGAYLDDDFREVSLREVYYQPKRLVAPSYGFDLVPVLGHCLKARNISVWRDAAIIGIVGVAACLSWRTLLVVAATLINVQLLVATWRLARDTIRRLRTGVAFDLNVVLARAVLLAIGYAVSFSVLLMISLSLSMPQRSSFESPYGATETDLTVSGGGVFLLGLLVLSVPLAFALWRQRELTTLTPGRQPSWPTRTPRLEEIFHQQRGNTVVYSGFTPFVGSGEVIGTWGYAQRLVHPAPEASDARHVAQRPGGLTEGEREFTRPPFDAQELITYVRGHLSGLLPGGEAEEHIPGLTIEDRVFISGTEVSHLAPYTSPAVMAAIIRHPTTPARHYLACQVVSWGGELVTTVFVHVAVQGRSLYLELTSTALAPCSERYRIVDSVEGTGVVAWLRAARDGILDTPRTVAKAPGNLVRSVINLITLSAGTGGTAALPRGYDYGARIGIRELGTRDELRNFTQQQDILKFKKLIERRVFASVLDFLDSKGVDTTEYRARAASVLNIGVGHFGSGNMSFQAPVTGQQQSPPAAAR